METNRPIFLFKLYDKGTETCRTRRHLPHWHQPGVTYFVTWRLADAVSQEQLNVWREERRLWLLAHPKPWSLKTASEFKFYFQEKQDIYLDSGYGECILKEPKVASIVEQSLLQFDGIRYDLGPYVIMPNHVHVLVAPTEETSLSKVLHGWKGFTAKEINKCKRRTGSVWWDESFDHIVRTFDHVQRFSEYIRKNPELAGGRSTAVLGEGKKVWVCESSV